MPDTILEKICLRKAQYIGERKNLVTLDSLKEACDKAPAPRGFADALRRHEFPAVIAEIKRASPSKGMIREDFDPPILAEAYNKGGAACLSVLTDEPFFQGHDDYLKLAHKQTPLPILRKDFMLEEYQIYESRALGADCILLIMAVLEDERAAALNSLARDLGMDVLVEVHDEEELARALKFKPVMIGVNNRNLKTMEVDFKTSRDLAARIPDETLNVTESGIYTHDDIKDLADYGFEAFLVGESLMRQGDVTKALQSLRGA